MAKRGSYAKSAARRDEILRQALAVIDAEGYGAASVARIAEVAGISKTGLLHHFGTKENLFTEVLRLRDELDGSMFEHPNAELADVESAYLRVVERNTRIPGLVELFTRLSIEATDPEHPAHEFFLRREKVIGDRIAATVDAALADDVRGNVDPSLVALIVMAATDGLQQRWLLDPNVDMAGALEALFRVFDTALGTGSAQREDHE
ncbi:TetR/AcrR family transcriptional regulator [Paramicrobacterium chengjingii]|uniref:TetR/AcrR family transcriptional regulator n=1 Tax=Paramicrobacterium chengjingii TaxID=2769067 RepID=A0ABX6YIC1_9MICO|nr:TetR/AcrR family transcriptional regulator [Microbacterium chengjingii]QPZ38344.1 TetR/AcrR family transcriptional regulator [Microbacterium chengjingii]